MSKTFIAFAMSYYEASCGCDYTRFYECYERNVNIIKRFDTYEEANKLQ